MKIIYFIPILLLIGFTPAFGTIQNFTETNPEFQGHVKDTGNNDVCDGDTLLNRNATSDQTANFGPWEISLSDDCDRAYLQFDIDGSLPDPITVTQVRLIIETGFSNDRAPCDFVALSLGVADNDIRSATNQTIWNAIGTNQTVLDASTLCNTSGTQQSFIFNASMNNYIETQNANGDFAILGIKMDDEIINASRRNMFIDTIAGSPVPTPTLEISFISGAVTNLGNTTTNILNIGDAVNLNATIRIAPDSNPDPTLSQIQFFRNSTLLETINISPVLQLSEGVNVASNNDVYSQLPTASDVYNFTAVATINYTNTESFTLVVEDTGDFITAEYNPDYFTADAPVHGLVNFTHSRFNNEDSLQLKVNRNLPSDTWQIECLYQDQTQAIQNTTQGTWHNFTNIGYLNDTISSIGTSHIYVSCWNDHRLFTFTSFSNGSLALLGIAGFDSTIGEFLGVPVGVFFIIMAATMATSRTANIWIIILLGMIGIMSTIGFFTLDAGTWALALILGAFGIFLGRKFL